MKLGKARWLSLVLAFLMLLSCVAQAEVAPASKVALASLAKSTISKPEAHSISTLPGVQTIEKGKGVTYKFTQPYYLVGNRLTTEKPIKKASLSSISFAFEGLMGMNDDYNYYTNFQPLLVNIKPSNATFTVTRLDSSDPSVVQIVTSNNYLWLLGLKPGSATITIITGNGKKATKKVTVNPATKPVLFSSMSIGEMISNTQCVTLKSKTMYAGDWTYLLAQPRPYTATYYDYPYYKYYDYCTSAVTYTSSNGDVATAMEGYLFAIKPGTATITATARDGSKKKASFKLTVKAKNPENFTVTPKPLGLNVGTTYQLKGNFTPTDYYDQKVTWTSSNPGVAKVSATGLVTAVSAGTATITGKTKVGGLTDTCAVTVSYGKTATGTKYRFYGIGNGDYQSASKLPACINDVVMMNEVAKDAGFDAYDYKTNLTGSQIWSYLYSIALNSNIDGNDVTVIYYSGHGLLSPNKSERGALCGVDSGYVTVDEVQELLELIDGNVILILDSCLSGQFITSKGGSSKVSAADIAAFNSAWTSATANTALTSKALTSSAQNYRFKILTAAAPLESSWGGDANGFGWFSAWAAQGLGRIANYTNGTSSAGTLEADTSPKDNAVTLNELYAYVKKNLEGEMDPVYQQHVQVWPASDNTAIVNKNA